MESTGTIRLSQSAKDYFNPSIWETLPEFEKKRLQNILENYVIMKELDLNPETPEFIIKFKNEPTKSSKVTPEEMNQALKSDACEVQSDTTIGPFNKDKTEKEKPLVDNCNESVLHEESQLFNAHPTTKVELKNNNFINQQSEININTHFRPGISSETSITSVCRNNSPQLFRCRSSQNLNDVKVDSSVFISKKLYQPNIDEYDLSLFTEREISKSVVSSFFYRTMLFAYINKLLETEETRNTVISILSPAILDYLDINLKENNESKEEILKKNKGSLNSQNSQSDVIKLVNPKLTWTAADFEFYEEVYFYNAVEKSKNN